VKRLEQGALDAPQYYPKAQIRQGADRSAEREGQSSPPAHRGARVIRTDALRFTLILQEPRGGQERKQDSEDDPDINAHQSSPAAALPTNSSLTDGIYFDDLVAQAPARKPSPLFMPLSGRGSGATGLHRQDGYCSYFNPRRHPQPSAQPSRRRLSRTACPACSGIAMSA
jgi:hypothetical protein